MTPQITTAHCRQPQSQVHTRIQNIPDPSRVGRPDARTDQQGANDALNSGVLRYDSNLQFFLQQMRDMPELGAELSKLSH